MKRQAPQLTMLLAIALLVACIGLTPIHQPALGVSEPGRIIAVQKMGSQRAAHTATRLLDGRILIVGGFTSDEQALSSAELFDPRTRTFTPTASMAVARQSHTATLLPDGKVLIAGGFNGNYLASVEIYDPVTERFNLAGSMREARSNHVALLLDTGKVLLAGGVGAGWTFLASAVLYEPVTQRFISTGSMMAPHESHTATRLQNGEVLIAGGHQGRRAAMTIYASAELYNPLQGNFRTTGAMTIKRHKHDATRLADGRVFISGGSDERDNLGAYTSTEIYDPARGQFISTANMHAARYKHTGTSVLLPSGMVLFVGGAATSELYNPRADSFYPLSPGVGATRLFATATALTNGAILLAGGYGPHVKADAQAWLYLP